MPPARVPPAGRGPLVRVGLWAVAVLVAAGLLGATRIACQAYQGERDDFVRTPRPAQAAQPGIPGLEEVSFAAAGAQPLAAWYVPSRNRAAVILVHGTNAERSSLLPEARILAQAGFGVLALDLPGQGASGGTTRWGEGEEVAISAAVTWLAGRAEVDRERIGGYGLSFGGFVLLEAAARDLRLRALVLASTPFDLDAETRLANRHWGVLSELPALWALHRYRGQVVDLPPAEAVHQLAPRAVLVLGGERDGMVPPRACRQLFAAASDPKELWIVPGAGHAGFAAVAPRAYAQHLVGFFSRALGVSAGG